MSLTYMAMSISGYDSIKHVDKTFGLLAPVLSSTTGTRTRTRTRTRTCGRTITLGVGVIASFSMTVSATRLPLP